MKSMIWKSTLREIRQSLGRFFAILAIVALGVGFLAGLKVTGPAMRETTERYFEKTGFYDYRLLSTVGFAKESIKIFQQQEDVQAVEGAVSFDIICKGNDSSDYVLKAHSITENVNQIVVVEGRLPESDAECAVDANLYDSSIIGKTITLSEENAESDLAHFTYREYVVTGLVQSSYYIQFERGNSSLGNGRINGFIYLLPEGFAVDYFTEVLVKFAQSFPLYSDEYDTYLDEKKETWENLAAQEADKRYNTLLNEAKEALAQFQAEMAAAQQTNPDAKMELVELDEPESYVMGRNTNVGYVCFESDSNIVDGIANIFPVFFFLVAALVCSTTMNRMVEEQRTQIGVLKALGYSERTIMFKYIFYSGSAAVTGCVIGFFGGTLLFPKVIWYVYGLMYRVDTLVYVLDWKLALISLLVSLVCSIGTTWISCRYELFETAAELMRPKAPKAGKRVFLEYVPIIWKRLKFLQKASVRNIFRYKKRFFMMILGISGCTALLVTGFGIKDSIADVAKQQYTEIQIYDISVTYSAPMAAQIQQELEHLVQEGVESYMFVLEKTVDLEVNGKTKSINLVVADSEEPTQMFLDLHTADGELIAYPEKNMAVISHKLAADYDVNIGDSIVLRDENQKMIEVNVSGISQNFVYNFVYLSADTYKEQMESEPEYKNVYINVTENQDAHVMSTVLMNMDHVTAVSVNEDIMERISSMLNSLNVIVVVIIFCAAGLAFIVLYNLTNINITERVREIATIKVLGFYVNETCAYVFRENTILTFIGALVGLVLGHFLHAFVMNEINIDMLAFDTRILPVSFLYSVILTLVFSCLVNQFMKTKIDHISMTESLKSVD